MVDVTMIENMLWKLEIDIENASDIVKRMENLIEVGWTGKVSRWFKSKFSL